MDQLDSGRLVAQCVLRATVDLHKLDVYIATCTNAFFLENKKVPIRARKSLFMTKIM